MDVNDEMSGDQKERPSPSKYSPFIVLTDEDHGTRKPLQKLVGGP